MRLTNYYYIQYDKYLVKNLFNTLNQIINKSYNLFDIRNHNFKNQILKPLIKKSQRVKFEFFSKHS